MDKGLLMQPAPGAAYPAEIMEVAKATGLSSRKRCGRRRSAGRTRGSSGPAATTGSGISRRATAIGSFDLLKIMSSHPSQAYGRWNRFRYLGLINEPCFKQPTAADDKHFGLWIDQRDPDCRARPLRRQRRGGRAIPAVSERAARPYWSAPSRSEQTVPVGSYYGEPTGVIGLRLFPNPDFDEEAAERWDAKRFYDGRSYYNDKNLVRPYRVGMSCAFCHVGPNPITPPEGPGKPALVAN